MHWIQPVTRRPSASGVLNIATLDLLSVLGCGRLGGGYTLQNFLPSLRQRPLIFFQSFLFLTLSSRAGSVNHAQAWGGAREWAHARARIHSLPAPCLFSTQLQLHSGTIHNTRQPG